MTTSKDSRQPDLPERGGYPSGDITAGELPAPPLETLTPEQEAELRERFAAAVKEPRQRFILPQRKPLSDDELRQLLRECVTVVAPGEVLVIRTTGLTPNQMREYQEAVTRWLDENAPGIKALVIHGEGGQIVRVDPRDGVFTIDEARRLMGLPGASGE